MPTCRPESSRRASLMCARRGAEMSAETVMTLVPDMNSPVPHEPWSLLGSEYHDSLTASEAWFQRFCLTVGTTTVTYLWIPPLSPSPGAWAPCQLCWEVSHWCTWVRISHWHLLYRLHLTRTLAYTETPDLSHCHKARDYFPSLIASLNLLSINTSVYDTVTTSLTHCHITFVLT